MLPLGAVGGNAELVTYALSLTASSPTLAQYLNIAGSQ